MSWIMNPRGFTFKSRGAARVFPARGRSRYTCSRVSPEKRHTMKSEKISELTTSRLSVYLRCLNLLAAAGIKTISSQALADQFNMNSADTQRPRLLRRVRHARRGLLGGRAAPTPHADTRARPRAPRRHCRRGQPR